MAGPAEQVTDVLSFGPFRLVASERFLTKDGMPVELGARTLDLLIALASSPNEIVSKKDLLARTWPDVTVEEGSLRFHIAALRKALADGQGGARYIATAGRAGLLLRGHGLAVERPGELARGGCRQFSASQPACPLGPNGRARRRRSQGLG
jgi:DNA-binding winged helix-turn-helix (wHTH) protein